jgi:hypothetical protein
MSTHPSYHLLHDAAPIICQVGLCIERGKGLSEVIAIAKVFDEFLIYIDFDRPVWQNKRYKNLSIIPNLDSFMCDGILGAISEPNLSRTGIQTRFPKDGFNKIPASAELQGARKLIYNSPIIFLELFHLGQIDAFLAEDLSRFAGKLMVNQVTPEEFSSLLK